MARIELLNARHCRDGFDCGEPALNDFLLRLAGQQQRRGFGKTYVAVSEAGANVLGFVTVSAGQVATDQRPAHLKLPRYPVPMLRIGRLAVSRSHQGHGIGQDLLAFALNLALEFSRSVGLYAVVVDAKHEKARALYAGLGFQACGDNPLCLYMPIAALERATRPNATG
ncbi:MAG: GNAT family N-acetyltransferase [Gallionellaceae bacterium]|nr:GNAT family N-acetyltransferase [Gallionellaceae bacterium]